MDAAPTILYLGFRAKYPHHNPRLAGIHRFARTNGWRVVAFPPEQCAPVMMPALLSRFKPAGCLVDESMQEVILRRSDFGDLPVVRIDPPPKRHAGRLERLVVCDNAAVAAAAFRELSAAMPPCYGIVSYRMRRTWARERVAAFRALCRDAGRECHVFPERGGETPEARAARLALWVAALPLRCAVFAVNDYTAHEAWRALQACVRHVPRSATLIGVDGFSTKPGAAASRISSVRLDFERTGYLAARALAEMLAPRDSPRHLASAPKANPAITFGPLMVVRRESTRGFGRREPWVAEAVEAIRREACDGLGAAALAARFKCSRNLFERRFREARGHSVLDEILHVRLEQVQALLARADMKIGAIASFSGFKTERELQKLFRIRMGVSMRQWRKNWQ